MDADTITTIINNKIESVRPASEFPDIARFHDRSVYDDKGNEIGEEKVPVRFIKFTFVNKEGELVDDEDEAVVIFVEHCDKNGRNLMRSRGIRPAKK